MQLTIKTLKGEQFKVDVEPSDVVLSIKSKIGAVRADHPAERLKLIHAGKVLKDDASVGELGIAENDFIVCMVTKEVAKPKPVPAPAPAAVMTTPAPQSNPVVPPAPSQPPAVAPPATPADANAPLVQAASTPQAPAASVVQPEVLANLVSMGFPESECKAALTAAQGNADLAVEFLMGGIPPAALQASTARPNTAIPGNASPDASTGNPLDAFRSHPQFNQLKQLVQQNPAAITQVMDAIGRQNPGLLEAIHANHDGFVAMMNEPITETPPAAPMPAAVPSMDAGMGAFGGAGQPNPAQLMQMLAMLPPDQRAQLAQSMGMTAEQLQGMMQMMSSMPPEQLQQLTSQMGGGGGTGGGNVVRLTEEEMQSVNRLMELGFSQQEAAQAFIACDRNEALAANLLLEGGWADGGDDAMGYEDEYQG